jgi:CDP-4-dehydro-6-deoxyglucose reductase
MALDSAETLSLYWIAATETGRYYDNLCRAWSDALDNFLYVPLTLRGEPDEGTMREALDEILQRDPRTKESDVYVAGPRALTDAALRLLPERGLPRERLLVNTLEV